jgi:hypothetical protein
MQGDFSFDDQCLFIISKEQCVLTTIFECKLYVYSFVSV